MCRLRRATKCAPTALRLAVFEMVPVAASIQQVDVMIMIDRCDGALRRILSLVSLFSWSCGIRFGH
jgi:hypothetical protein